MITPTFDEYAQTYQDKFNENFLGKYQRQQVQQIILTDAKTAKNVLDVGCGPGSDFEFYAQLNLQVHAIDISPEMVRFAKEKATALSLNANIQVAEIQSFKPSKRYDLIVMNFGVINAIADIENALNALKNALAPNGKLVIVSMPPFHGFSFLGDLLRLRIKTAIQRVFQEKAVLGNGFTIYYYRKPDFIRHFKLAKKKHLGAFLPTPDQYLQRGLFRSITKLLLPIDRVFSNFLPDFLGGDHVCYILENRQR